MTELEQRPALQVIQGRPHDLPPQWDGEPVTWRPWHAARTTLQFHAPPEALACEQCGTVDEPAVARGSRPPADGATFTVSEPRRTRSGREYVRRVQRPAWPVRDLTAYRCRHCGHDQVRDDRTGEQWDLDAEDYGDDGSRPADVLF